ncbi:MAG: DapH/DapD/GlmU-related protein [Actinomycetes bacterium]
MSDGSDNRARSRARRALGRGGWIALSPLYYQGKRIKRMRRRCTRTWFMVRVRLAAMLSRASVMLDVHPDADISGGVRLDIWYGTHTSLRVGDGAHLRRDVLLSLRGGSVSVGAGTDVRRVVTLQVSGHLSIGSGAVVSTGTVIHCAEAVHIDDLTIIGEYATIADSAHLRTPPGVPVHHASRSNPVKIGSNVWIGAHAIIASGVTVGDQAIVGGGAVVLRDAPAGWLTAGNPARPLRELEATDTSESR